MVMARYVGVGISLIQGRGLAGTSSRAPRSFANYPPPSSYLLDNIDNLVNKLERLPLIVP